MKYIFNFPDIGEGLEEGTIVEWYVEKGMEVKSGDPLVKMETDKVVTDIPSPKTGIISAVYGKVGEVINVGNALVEIEIEGVLGEAAIKEANTDDFSIEAIEEDNAGVVGTIEVAGNNAYMPSSNEGLSNIDEQNSARKPKTKILATPVARAMAKELNVDINIVNGTGPAGRVMIEDIKKFVNTGQANEAPVYASKVSEFEEVTYKPLSQMRKAIARNMSVSKQNAVHMSVHDEVEISELFSVRNRFKQIYSEKGVKLSYLPFIIKATVKALQQYKIMNAQLDLENSRIIYKNFYNIGIAVDTPEGLVVPVIRNADKLTVIELAKQLNTISEKAQNKSLSLDDMKAGTFTITSYGSIGGYYAVPVINYPQTGILGIGRITEKPVIKNNEIVKGIVMPLSLSVDHRIVDGGEVTRFLNKIMYYLADPIALIMD